MYCWVCHHVYSGFAPHPSCLGFLESVLTSGDWGTRRGYLLSIKLHCSTKPQTQLKKNYDFSKLRFFKMTKCAPSFEDAMCRYAPSFKDVMSRCASSFVVFLIWVQTVLVSSGRWIKKRLDICGHIDVFNSHIICLKAKYIAEVEIDPTLVDPHRMPKSPI